MTTVAFVATCQICEQEFADRDDLIPRILSECGHTLCSGCVAKIKKDSKSIACPFDRIMTEVKDGEVKNLKKNYCILQMLEDHTQQKRQRTKLKRVKKARKNDGTCDENWSHRAEYYCKACDADLCNDCWDCVHSLTILAHHEKSPLFEKPVEPKECEIHKGEQAVFVCKVEKCKQMQNRLMCHICFREHSTSHFGHGYVPLQTEVYEIRTKILNVMNLAGDKEVTILRNIEFLEGVIQTHKTHGETFDERYLEVTRFRTFTPETNEAVHDGLKTAMNDRVYKLQQRISNQRINLDWIRKNKAALERLRVKSDLRLVEMRFEVDIAVNRIETAIVDHPKSLATSSMCIVHVSSLNPLKVEMKPAYRLDIRENYHNHVTSFIEQNSRLVSPKTNTLRYKNKFLRLVDRTEDTKLYSEGLSLILIVDPFGGDRDRHFVALELLENAIAYENIIVGLTPFNFQTISTFLAKLVELGDKDPRIQIVYINDPETDIEKIVDLSLSR